MAYQVFRDSAGAYLVSQADSPADRSLWWPTWMIDTRGTHGPQALGSWLKFVVSDWAEAEGPYPDAVAELMCRLDAGNVVRG
jgi:hypothetical protein